VGSSCVAALLLGMIAGAGPELTADCLVHMSHEELESLYCASPPAPVLDGYFPGRSSRMPRVTGMVWKGKQFCAADASIINRWCFGIMAVQAQVYPGESWLDGKPALIMDYRGSSKVWSNVRDELREVAPGLYLGIMYKEAKYEKGKCEPKLVEFFVLESCCH
jgi:hypothetical protein